MTVKRYTYHCLSCGVVLWHGDVMVADFLFVCCQVLSIPHEVVEVWKVMVHVNALIAVAT